MQINCSKLELDFKWQMPVRKKLIPETLNTWAGNKPNILLQKSHWLKGICNMHMLLHMQHAYAVLMLTYKISVTLMRQLSYINFKPSWEIQLYNIICFHFKIGYTTMKIYYQQSQNKQKSANRPVGAIILNSKWDCTM